MSKVFNAECSAAGKVSIEGYEIPDAQVMSAGKAQSQGTAFMDGDKTKYIPNNTGDIETTLQKIVDVLQQIATALTTIDAKPTGGTGSAPVATVASQVAQINAIRTELNTLKGALK